MPTPRRAAAARTATRDSRPAAARRRCGIATAGLFALALIGGCSSTDEFFNGQPPPPGGGAPSFTERFRSLFGSRSEAEVAPVSPVSPASSGAGTPLNDCPTVGIRQGASTLQTTAPGSDGAMAVRYQATFGRTARQCALVDGNLTFKVGVQGRLILGPAGAPGDTTVPLRYALVKEGLQPQTLWSKLYLVPVAVPPDQPNVPFTHVMEDMAVPMPPGREIDHYVIYVGFDPKGVEEKPKRGRKGR